MPDTHLPIIDKLIAEIGGGNAAELARTLDVKRQMVFHWRRRGEIPLEYAIAIETSTNGRFSVQDMSPNASRRIRSTMQKMVEHEERAKAVAA